jgi:hypothetical protein
VARDRVAQKLVDLIRAGLATAKTECMVVGGSANGGCPRANNDAGRRSLVACQVIRAPMTQLILKRASASRPSGQWDEDDVLADRCAPRRMMTHCIFFFQRDLVINFAQTRLGTLRYIFAITDSGPESGAGDRETGRAPA